MFNESGVMGVKSEIVEELHKPARKNFQRRRVILKGLNDLYQADLVEMVPYAKVNQGYRYILVVINAFSKFVWALPVKRKTGSDVTKAMHTIISSVRKPPKNLQTDMGKEFYNKDFAALMQTFGINHYSTFSNLKSSIVERFNRTLKGMMWKTFSLQGSYKWLNILPDIVIKYNSTVHRTIGLKPKDVNNRHTKHLLNTVYSKVKTIDRRKPRFRVGDHVRISKYRVAFQKGYRPNWTHEVFKVVKVCLTNPRTYLLQDANNEEIKGGFYDYELQLTKHPDTYFIDKVLKRSGNKLFVKWLGLDNRHNSWISKNHVLI